MGCPDGMASMRPLSRHHHIIRNIGREKRSGQAIGCRLGLKPGGVYVYIEIGVDVDVACYDD